MKNCLLSHLTVILNQSLLRQNYLRKIYQRNCKKPSDIHEHLPLLRELAKECSTVTEIGTRGMVSTWGILLGLSENVSEIRSYTGIDLALPPKRTLQLAKLLAQKNRISFQFWNADDMKIDIQPSDLLFIDSLHTYAHLTFELEKFSSKVSKYIALHDTSAPWGEKDDDEYHGNFSEYPLFIDRNKRGLWLAVGDFLDRHPEWVLHKRYLNCHGFTILKRVEG
ncbi:MAG: hypothetical protein JSS30_00350 [Verrucomicrobia bacterium]|nr:hypothetical protein [Verrucomicrobiota bacterium]